MVLIPIIGANVMEIADGTLTDASFDPMVLIFGFITAFVVGFVACKWMIKIVNKGKLIYFAAYCLIVGVLALVLG